MFESQDFLAASDYLLAWGLYAVAALVLFALLWRVTRRWQTELRWLVRGLVLVLLALPSPVPGHAVLAPVIAFLTLGIVSGHGADVFAPVLVKLLLAAVGVVVLVVIAAVLRRRSAAEAERQAARARRRAT